MSITPQFLAGLVLGAAIGVVALVVISEWLSMRQSEHAFDGRLKRSSLVRVK